MGPKRGTPPIALDSSPFLLAPIQGPRTEAADIEAAQGQVPCFGCCALLKTVGINASADRKDSRTSTIEYPPAPGNQ